MDIQISSNFERLLFLLLDRDDEKMNAIMKDLKEKGSFSIDAATLEKFRSEFLAARISNEEGIDVMKRYHQEWKYVLDPHTAIGVGAAEKLFGSEEEVVCLATAHPGKFQEPVEQALGSPYQLPAALSSLKDLPKRKEVIAASVEKVKAILLK
jgi:threonine synthase